jgi:hypothetical protein
VGILKAQKPIRFLTDNKVCFWFFKNISGISGLYHKYNQNATDLLSYPPSMSEDQITKKGGG